MVDTARPLGVSYLEVSRREMEVRESTTWVLSQRLVQNAIFGVLDRHAPGCRSLVVARMTLNPLDPSHTYQ